MNGDVSVPVWKRERERLQKKKWERNYTKNQTMLYPDTFCYRLNVCVPPPPHPNLYVESLNLSVVEFGDGAFKEVIKVKWGHKGGVLIQ